MTRATTAEELEAAASVAAELAIGPITPVVLSLAKHSIIRLAPLPLVARLCSAGDPALACAGLARELKVADHLAGRQAPVVRPAWSFNPGPHVRGRCVMTIWDFTPHGPVAIDRDAWLAARSLRQFHKAFASFDGPLPLLTDSIDACGQLLADGAAPRLGPVDRRFLIILHGRLREALNGFTYRVSPIHGDAHLGNALLTNAGIVWGDLETACLGPREWDIACLPASTWPAYDGFDLDLARCLADLRSVCVATWCWADYGRNPQVDEAAEYHLRLLRERLGEAAPAFRRSEAGG